jgi:hypothetical protein
MKPVSSTPHVRSCHWPERIRGLVPYAPEDADNIKWTLPAKPIVISEFGAEATQVIHGGNDERWSEEQQVKVYEHQFIMINKIPQVRGVIPWVLMDFRSPTRNIPKLQDGFNRKGLISEEGKKKQSFFLFKKHTKTGPWERLSNINKFLYAQEVRSK